MTVLGGKWTTYRQMGEDTVNVAAQAGNLPPRSSRTANLPLHGWVASEPTDQLQDSTLSVYGSDRQFIEKLATVRPELGELLHRRLPYRGSEVVWAVQNEMARTVEDVLARRTRALFLDARAAIEAAPRVATLMAAELDRSAEWMERQIDHFTELAEGYLYSEE